MLYAIVIVLTILALHLYYVNSYNKLFDRVTLLEKQSVVEQDAVDMLYQMFDVMFTEDCDECVEPTKKTKKDLTRKKK